MHDYECEPAKARNATKTRPTRDGIYDISPDIQRHWLEHYLSPRQAPGGVPWRQSDWREAVYASAMRKNKVPGDIHGWMLTGGSIAFDTQGWIIDGANRLRAALQAGVTFQNRVTVGNPPEAFTVTDCNWGRNHAQIFTMAGYTSAAMCSAMCLSEAQYKSGWSKARTTSQDLLAWADRRQAAVEGAVAWGRKHATVVKGWFPPSMLAWARWHIDQHADWSEEFLVPFSTGENLPSGDPRLAMRRQLEAQVRAKLSKGSAAKPFDKIEKQAMLVLTHNKWVNGEEAKTIQLPKRINPSTGPAKATGYKKTKPREKRSARPKDSWPKFNFGT